VRFLATVSLRLRSSGGIVLATKGENKNEHFLKSKITHANLSKLIAHMCALKANKYNFCGFNRLLTIQKFDFETATDFLMVEDPVDGHSKLKN
jgi:hypothetical protein